METKLLSQCCKKKVTFKLGDGRYFGFCDECGHIVMRVRPGMLDIERVPGLESPWTPMPLPRTGFVLNLPS